MADDIKRDKDQYQEEKVRQDNEFKALKIKHLTTVSDKRAVIPRHEIERKQKLTRQRTLQLQKQNNTVRREKSANNQMRSGKSQATRLMLSGENKPVHEITLKDTKEFAEINRN